MIGNLVTTTEPTAEPLTLDEVKKQLGIAKETTHHDQTLNRLITTARQEIEKNTGHRLITQVVTYYLYNLEPVISLPVAPIQSIDSFQYYDQDGALQAMSAIYFTDLISKPGQILLKPSESWPTLEDGRPNRVIITMTVGYGDDYTTVKGVFVSAMLMFIELLFDRPESDYSEVLRQIEINLSASHNINWF